VAMRVVMTLVVAVPMMMVMRVRAVHGLHFIWLAGCIAGGCSSM
jgi:preprotein translocase subunit SecF